METITAVGKIISLFKFTKNLYISFHFYHFLPLVSSLASCLPVCPSWSPKSPIEKAQLMSMSSPPMTSHCLQDILTAIGPTPPFPHCGFQKLLSHLQVPDLGFHASLALKYSSPH